MFLILAELERLRLENEAQQRVIEAQQQKLEGTAETFCCLQAAELLMFLLELNSGGKFVRKIQCKQNF